MVFVNASNANSARLGHPRGTVAAVVGSFVLQLRDTEQLLPDVALSGAACTIAQ